jgi:TetR/AcrR family fatty acid metabolism transcriptional regulator
MSREEVIKEYRVREILEAARKIIGRFGIQATTIDRVAEEAKVAKGTIYLYFPSKDELVHVAVLEGFRSMNAELFRLDDRSSQPLDRIRALIRGAFKIQASNLDFLKTFIIGNALDIEHDSPHGREFLTQYRAMLDYMAAILREAIEQGAVRDIDPDFAAYMLSELITGSLRRHVLGFASNALEADADAVVEFFLRGVKAKSCG